MGEPGERWGAGPDRDLSRTAAGVRGTENRPRAYDGTAEAAGAQASRNWGRMSGQFTGLMD